MHSRFPHHGRWRFSLRTFGAGQQRIEDRPLLVGRDVGEALHHPEEEATDREEVQVPLWHGHETDSTNRRRCAVRKSARQLVPEPAYSKRLSAAGQSTFCVRSPSILTSTAVLVLLSS